MAISCRDDLHAGVMAKEPCGQGDGCADGLSVTRWNRDQESEIISARHALKLKAHGLDVPVGHERFARIEYLERFSDELIEGVLLHLTYQVHQVELEALMHINVHRRLPCSATIGGQILNETHPREKVVATAERIRDKIAASKQKGMWMGGRVPPGYKLANRKLLIDEESADFVRALFSRYLELRSVSGLMREISGARASSPFAGTGSNTRKPTSHGHLRHLLSNPIYIGKLRHRDQLHDDEHEPIIAPSVFVEV